MKAAAAALVLAMIAGLAVVVAVGAWAGVIAQRWACPGVVVDEALMATVAEVLDPGATDPRAALLATGLHRPDVQLGHAATIVGVGQRLGVPTRGLVVALATAHQESRLRVLANPVVPESLVLAHDDVSQDHDSVGIFQQRHTTGWGTVPELMDPATSASKFFERLVATDGWEQLPVTVAAQAVQRSAFPDLYARWEPMATALVQVLTDPTTPRTGACSTVALTGAMTVGDWSLPVPPATITDPALLSRPHHTYPAWDLGLPPGTPVLAPVTGSVVAVTTEGSCGWGVIVDDPAGWRWTLCHATPGSVTVTTGQVVARGQVVMASGNSGRSTGPHLHLSIDSPDGRRVCPQPWLLGLWRGTPVPLTALPTTGCVSGTL